MERVSKERTFSKVAPPTQKSRLKALALAGTSAVVGVGREAAKMAREALSNIAGQQVPAHVQILTAPPSVPFRRIQRKGRKRPLKGTAFGRMIGFKIEPNANGYTHLYELHPTKGWRDRGSVYSHRAQYRSYAIGQSANV